MGLGARCRTDSALLTGQRQSEDVVAEATQAMVEARTKKKMERWRWSNA